MGYFVKAAIEIGGASKMKVEHHRSSLKLKTSLTFIKSDTRASPFMWTDACRTCELDCVGK